MEKLNKAIADTANILDSLRLLREILESGDCNTCTRECSYVPDVGALVRYNCPFYKKKEK